MVASLDHTAVSALNQIIATKALENLSLHGFKYTPITGDPSLHNAPYFVDRIWNTVCDVLALVIHKILPDMVRNVYGDNQTRMRLVEPFYDQQFTRIACFVMKNLAADGQFNKAEQALFERAKRAYLLGLKELGSAPSWLQKWTGTHLSQEFYTKHANLSAALQATLEKRGPAFTQHTDWSADGITYLAGNHALASKLNMAIINTHLGAFTAEHLVQILGNTTGLIHGLEVSEDQATALIANNALVERMSADQLDEIIFAVPNTTANYDALVKNALRHFKGPLTDKFVMISGEPDVRRLLVGRIHENHLVEHAIDLLARMDVTLTNTILADAGLDHRQTVAILNARSSLKDIVVSPEQMQYITQYASHLLARFPQETLNTHYDNICFGTDSDLTTRRAAFSSAMAVAAI